MDLNKFRIYHSTLIEHYQFIEAHLEGIYAAICEKPFSNGLEDVERDSMRHILMEIQKTEKEKAIAVFSNKERDKILRIIERRNFWCHNCYYDMLFDRKRGGPKKEDDVKTMMADLREAENLREELFSKKDRLLQKALCFR